MTVLNETQVAFIANHGAHLPVRNYWHCKRGTRQTYVDTKLPCRQGAVGSSVNVTLCQSEAPLLHETDSQP